MKIYRTIIILLLCFSLLPLSALHAESIKDNTYLILIRAPERLWADQFEFDAGDIFRAYTTREGEFAGKWIETELLETELGTDFDPFKLSFSSTWFQAFVEKSEEPTTTTSTPATTTIPTQFPRIVPESRVTPQQVKFDINIWGLAYTFIISTPDPILTDPLNRRTLGFSLMMGYGAYLGADVTFMGFAGVQGGGGGGGGGTPAFGSISPDEGEQESTLPAVEITGENTTFQDDGVNAIIFSPEDGLTITNITVQNNTTVEFDLEISASASTGLRSVIVTYDNFTKVITGESVFEVLPKP